MWIMGFDSHNHLARHLGMSLRSLQRYALIADALQRYPEMEQAFEEGMDLGRLEVVSPIAEETTVARWLEIAKRVPVPELRRAVSLATESDVEDVLSQYEEAMREATGSVALRKAKQHDEKPKLV